MWLVTGGAGYIGSHVIKYLEENSWDYLVVDNLSTGLQSRLPDNCSFQHLDICDFSEVNRLFQRFHFSGILHLGGLKFPEESMKLPDLYLKVNFEATKNLIDLAIKFGIENFVFSSSSSVYGDLNESYLSEDIPPNPISPYGLSKLLAESYLKEKVLMREIRGISLRYFNVVGTFSEALADRSKRNLFPLFHKAFREQGHVSIYGNDYPTPDGTCIRDYIHVLDVAGMHVEIMKDISKFGDPVLNLGRGSGLSVYQIYQAFTQYYKKELPIKWLPRRPGDPATVIGDVSRLQKKYGIFPKYNLADMVSY